MSAYAALAPIYDQIGMSSFASSLTPRLINYAQRNDWLGRRILDLGCGTGASIRSLVNLGYTMTGVDASAEMLAVPRADREIGRNYRWEQQDIRQLGDNLDPADLVLALDVLNELSSLNELNLVFQGVQKLLPSGRWFIFDMHTIEGLIQRGQGGGGIIFDNKTDLMVFAQNTVDYERQGCIIDYTILQQRDGSWVRTDTQRVLRGYPIQAVAGLLTRNGLTLLNVITLNFEKFEPGVSSAPRVLFVVKKQ